MRQRAHELRPGAGARRSGLPLALALVATLGGCTYSFVHRAERAYDEGRYLDAAERLASHESELIELRPGRRTAYTTYRGLSLLRLGDPEGARRWLGQAAALDKKHGMLAPKQRADLRAGIAELARLDGARRDRAPQDSASTAARAEP